MKKLISLALTVFIFLGLSGQSASTTPGTGHWVVIDSGYKVGTYTTGKTVVKSGPYKEMERMCTALHDRSITAEIEKK